MTTDNFLSEPKLFVFVCQQREKGIKSLYDNQVFNLDFSCVFFAEFKDHSDKEEEDYTEDVDDPYSARSCLLKELRKFVTLKRIDTEIIDNWNSISEYLLVRE